jgi:4-amino-4-deoxy-L-arabinose transferase-like glycosyltransferase
MVDLRTRRRPRTDWGPRDDTIIGQTAPHERAAFNRSPVAWLIVAAGLSFLLRAPFLTVPLITDEGGYAYVARRWLDGRGDLYGELWFDRPQGIFLAYGLILHTLGTGVAAIRLGAWMVTLLTLVIVWAFARAAFNRRVANLAALLFAVAAGSPAIEGFTANAEVFMALPAAGSAWLLWRASRNGWRARTLMTAGLLAGVATLLKPSGFVMLPLGLVYAGLVAASGVRLVTRRWAWLTIGVGLALAPAIVHGWLTGWNDFVAAVAYRAHQRSGTTVTPEEQLGSFVGLVQQIWPLLIAVAVPLGVRIWRDPRPFVRRRLIGQPGGLQQADGTLRLAAWLPTVPPGRGATALLRLWLLACLAGIAMGGNWLPHYVVQLVAPLAIALAVLLSDLGERISTGAWRALAVFVLVALLAPFGVVATTRGNTDEMSARLFDRTTYPAQDEIAAYLRAHTDPDEPVYVAFAQASIYYLADRPAAYRHIYMWELPGLDADLLALVESPDRPRYVVDMGQEPPWPDEGRAFWTAVAAHYRVETIIDGVTIYRAKEPSSPALLPSEGEVSLI